MKGRADDRENEDGEEPKGEGGCEILFDGEIEEGRELAAGAFARESVGAWNLLLRATPLFVRLKLLMPAFSRRLWVADFCGLSGWANVGTASRRADACVGSLYDGGARLRMDLGRQAVRMLPFRLRGILVDWAVADLPDL